MRIRLPVVIAGCLLAACGTEPTPPPPPFAGTIVFESDRASSDGAQVLFAMNPDGSDVQPVSVPLPPAYGQADISPDGERVAFDNGFALYTVRGDGTDLRLVVPSGKGANKPTWSPDGQTLIYTRYPVDVATRSQLWAVNSDGSNPRLLVAASDDALNPAYSPDGSWIAYEGGPGYATNLWLVHPDGTGNHSIFAVGDTATVHDPAWSPDGQRISFSLGLNIATIRADGTGLQVLTDSAQNFDPDWGPALPP